MKIIMALKNDKSKKNSFFLFHHYLKPKLKNNSVSPSFKTKIPKNKFNDASPSSSKMSSNRSSTPPLPFFYSKPSRKVMRSPYTANNTNILRIYTCSLREGKVIAFVTKSHNIKEAGFLYPIQDKNRNDHNFKSSIDVDITLERKSIDNEDINKFMPSSEKV